MDNWMIAETIVIGLGLVTTVVVGWEQTRRQFDRDIDQAIRLANEEDDE